MLDKLKFVQGAVAKKDFIPELTHFVIENGTVRGYNGMIAICSPIPVDINCKPKAAPLVQAINKCKDTVQLSLTPTGRLAVKSGSFKAYVDCVQGEVPVAEPEGELVNVAGETLLNAFKSLEKFIGDDATRPWANGVLLRGNIATATNNVIIVEYWLGFTLPKELNIPSAAIKEIIRVGEPPIAMYVGATSVTFEYTDGRWIRSQLLNTDWPDVSKLFAAPKNLKPINVELYDALDTIKPFVDKMGRVFISEGTVSTHGAESVEGAAYTLEEQISDGIYNINMLQLLKDSVLYIDWSTWPAPCQFQGDNIRGAIIGMRPVNG